MYAGLQSRKTKSVPARPIPNNAIFITGPMPSGNFFFSAGAKLFENLEKCCTVIYDYYEINMGFR